MLVYTFEVLMQMYDICIVGSGPAGLACAIGCHARGLKVLVLEAGGLNPTPGVPDVLAADIGNPSYHDPAEIISAAAVGGSSHWWGGRSVPLDPSDFAAWPISYDELSPWYHYAGELLGCGSMLERRAPGAFANLEKFSAEGVESWAPEPNLSRAWRDRIGTPSGPTILLGARVTDLRREGGRIVSAKVVGGGKDYEVQARHFVVAGGGLASVRLMMLAQRRDRQMFGGPDGPLGRGYMGHMTGAIADLACSDPADASTFSYAPGAGSYLVRQRIHARAETIEREGINNIAFWFDNAMSHNAAHGSAVSSAKYLAARALSRMRSRPLENASPLGPHIENVRRQPLAAAAGLAGTVYTLAASRLTRQRYRPRRFLSVGDNAWRLVYHAEQKPDPQNRITLSGALDSIGMPKLRVNFNFAESDRASVVRAHDLLDRDLRAAGAGVLRYSQPEHERTAQVADMARDGYHQLGGAVMSDDPRTGVVDRNCRVHGLDNMWIASSAVFPTGGQANPTLTIIALAARLAERLAAVSRTAIRRPVALVASALSPTVIPVQVRARS